MHAEDHARSAETGKGRAPARSSQAANRTRPPGLLALQSSAGNAAVVQMLHRAGHPGAAEERRHDADHDDRQAEHPVQRSTVHDVLRAPGRPLDDATRDEMETRLGADFSDVRIHEDAAARVSAAEIGARAYTSGNHVVIGDGGADKHTLAHELTHVVQQRKGPVAGADNGTGLRVSDPSDRFEREAEANAIRAMSGQAVAHAEVRDAADRQSAVTEQTVQRAPDVQDRLTDAHWARQAQNKPAHPVRPPSGGRRLETVLSETVPALLEQFRRKYQGKSASDIKAMGQLELFRGMSAEEADAIMRWWNNDHLKDTAAWIKKHKDSEEVADAFHAASARSEIGVLPVGKHLGDERQARTYLTGDSSGKRLLKFTLKPGAHEFLFTPEYMGVSGTSPNRTPQYLRNIHGDDRPMPEARAGEGTLGGYVGLKQEQRGDFSISLGNSEASKLLFQHFVKKVEVVD